MLDDVFRRWDGLVREEGAVPALLHGLQDKSHSTAAWQLGPWEDPTAEQGHFLACRIAEGQAGKTASFGDCCFNPCEDRTHRSRRSRTLNNQDEQTRLSPFGIGRNRPRRQRSRSSPHQSTQGESGLARLAATRAFGKIGPGRRPPSALTEVLKDKDSLLLGGRQDDGRIAAKPGALSCTDRFTRDDNREV